MPLSADDASHARLPFTPQRQACGVLPGLATKARGRVYDRGQVTFARNASPGYRGYAIARMGAYPACVNGS